MDKNILRNAINNSDILSTGQKNILNTICASDYPMPAKSIEKAMGFTKQTIHMSLKGLLARDFIVKEKDGVFVYKLNPKRVLELIERYKASVLNKK